MKTRPAQSPAAPSVPSFGGLIGLKKSLPLPANPSQNKQGAPQIKRGTNVLGLTPSGEPQYSSSGSDEDDEDEDVDEEAMFAEVGSSLTFEHNGTVLSINSAADLAAWKKERAKNYPTRTRMAAKLEEKRRLGGERKRLLFEASRAIRTAKRPAFVVPPPESRLEKARKELAAQTEALAALRKQVAKSEAKIALARSTASDVQAAEALAQAEHLGLTTTVPDEAGSQDLPQHREEILIDLRQDDKHGDEVDEESAGSTSSESSSISSDSSDSDDDGPPEEASSKLSKDVPGTKKILCRDYVASGRCRDGDSCRFKHELPKRGTGTAYRENAQREQQEKDRRRKEENDLHDAKMMESRVTDRKTIFQRLLEQEHVGEDLLALQVIKALGKMDFFADSSPHVENAREPVVSPDQ